MSGPTDFWLGARVVRWWEDSDGCSHTGDNVCAACAGLNEREAAAVSEYLRRAGLKDLDSSHGT